MKRKGGGGPAAGGGGVCDYNFSPPSTKSRRLDGEFVPLMQADPREITVPQVIEQWLPLETDDPVDASVIDVRPLVNDKADEKALVLYDPPNTPFIRSPTPSSQFPIILDSALIPGIKDHLLWPGHSTTLKLLGDEATENESTEVSNNRTAVVPWVASQMPLATLADGQATGLPEPMEAELEVEMMDMEDNSHNSNNWKPFAFGQTVVGVGPEGLQKQQQHCMAPQFRQNESTVIW